MELLVFWGRLKVVLIKISGQKGQDRIHPLLIIRASETHSGSRKPGNGTKADRFGSIRPRMHAMLRVLDTWKGEANDGLRTRVDMKSCPNRVA